MEAHPAQTGDIEKRTVTNALRYALFVSVALAAVLLTLLALASGNDQLLERHYRLLLGLNIAVGLGLLLLAAELARRLWKRWRAGLFGTRLMARLALAFTLMTLAPVLLIYMVAVQFLGRSVESWYDVPMERALESGLTLGRASLDSLLGELQSRARTMASELSDLPASQWSASLDDLRDRAGVQEALIVSGTGRIVAASGGSLTRLLPDLPSPSALRAARSARSYAVAEPVGVASGDGAEAGGPRGLRMRVIEAIVQPGRLGDEMRLLQLLQPVPQTLAGNAEAVQQGWRDYQELALGRAGLKRIFRITMTVTLLLTVFSAIAASFLLAGWMTGPLAMLAAGTRAVAEGDFRPVKDYSGRDELGVLTQSFNAMTRQLEEARALVEHNQQELERANSWLASVLANLTAGVIVLDEAFRVSLANAGAQRILELGAEPVTGRLLTELPRLSEAGPQILQAFADLDATQQRAWQRQLSFRRGTDEGADAAPALTLLVRGAALPGPQRGWLVVFDDVSEVVSAQREVAWSEVARRFAHEIKNPLTPIRLGVQHMLRAYRDQRGDFGEILNTNVSRVLAEIDHLDEIARAFSRYGTAPEDRTPAVPVDVAAVVHDVIALERLGEDGEREAGVRWNIDAPEPGTEQVVALAQRDELKEVLLNVLENARLADAGTVSVHVTRTATHVVIDVQDNGTGIPADVLPQVFEPHFSTRTSGSGLGLAISRRLIEGWGGTIGLTSTPGGGTTVRLTLRRATHS